MKGVLVRDPQINPEQETRDLPTVMLKSMGEGAEKETLDSLIEFVYKSPRYAEKMLQPSFLSEFTKLFAKDSISREAVVLLEIGRAHV